jgi:hypothetical protein
MDPLSAVGLAGTVVQFVDFGCRIVSEGRELYKSGSVKLNAQAEAVTKDLLDFSAKLQTPPRLNNWNRPPTENELALRKLSDGCNEVAQELLARLSRLTPKLLPPEDLPNNAPSKDRERWLKRLKQHQREIEKMGNSLRLALLSVWTRKEIEEVEQRLAKYESAIKMRMLGCLGYVSHFLFQIFNANAN